MRNVINGSKWHMTMHVNEYVSNFLCYCDNLESTTKVSIGQRQETFLNCRACKQNVVKLLTLEYRRSFAASADTLCSRSICSLIPSG